MNTIDWTQHPIGHGGFHSALMEDEHGARFTWIFDCGARSHKKFHNYLQSWTARQHGSVDWLFISHFDFDHVSGLNALMSRSIVRNVMIPYVNDSELLYSLLEEIGRGNMDRAFVEMISDPAAFFISRGASHIIFLNGADTKGGDEPESSDPPRDQDAPPNNEDDLSWNVNIDKPLRTLPSPIWTKQQGSVSLIDGGSCSVAVSRSSVGLRLKTYRAPIAQANHQQMLVETQTLVGWRPSSSNGRPGLQGLAYRIARHARTEKGRKELQGIHKKYLGSSNRASLSLLSEPFNFRGNSNYWFVSTQSDHYFSHAGAGWMNTGDAELLAPSDLADWQACYSQHLDDVLVLALPHHGSDKNSDVQLQALCPNAILTAHVTSTSKHHPGFQVSSSASTRLKRVNEKSSTLARMVFVCG